MVSPSTRMAPAKQSPIPAPTVMGYLEQPLTDNNPWNSSPEFHRCHSSNHITTATIASTPPPCSTTTMTAPTTPLRSPPRRKSLELHLWFVLGCLALVVSFAFVQVEAGLHRVRRQHPLDQLQQDQLETQEQKSQHHRKVDKLVKDVHHLKDVGRFRYHGDRADDHLLTNDIDDDNRNDIVDDSAPSSDDHRGSRRHHRDHSRRQPRIRNSKHDDTRLSSYDEYIRIQGAEHNLSSRARPHRRARQQENKAGHRRRRLGTDAVRRVRHIRKKDNFLVEISERLQDVYGDQWKTWQREGRRDRRQQVEETVGCEGILGSSAQEDRCRVCEGDGSTCTTIDGLIDRQGFTNGYHDILLIPLGATNIFVKEVEVSNNYLAVRNLTGHFFFNGNWRINCPTARQFAGTTFHCEGMSDFGPEVIRALGPVLEPLYIALIYQEPNTGIRYQYSLPNEVARDLDETYTYTYKWRLGAWGECSLTCGGGSQNRTVTCASATDFVEVDTALCDPRLQRPENRTCNADPCQSSWQNGSWSDCTSSVCGVEGVRYRHVFCGQRVGQGRMAVINESDCDQAGDQPEAVEVCNKEGECPSWHVGEWKPCPVMCGDGTQSRTITCHTATNGTVTALADEDCRESGEKPEEERPCSAVPCEWVDWVTADWSGDETEMKDDEESGSTPDMMEEESGSTPNDLEESGSTPYDLEESGSTPDDVEESGSGSGEEESGSGMDAEEESGSGPEESGDEESGESGSGSGEEVEESGSAPQITTTPWPNDPCEVQNAECRDLQCPYGMMANVDDQGCRVCSCNEPCKDFRCPEGSQCAVDVLDQYNSTAGVVPVCREANKPGECPSLSQERYRCDKECDDDASCTDNLKCCYNGCGYSCLPPPREEGNTPPYTEPTQAVYTEAPRDREPAVITESDRFVTSEEQDVVTLLCEARGTPEPTVTWYKDGQPLDTTQGRFRIVDKGSLQVVGTLFEDTGRYTCVASNGLGQPDQREVELQITGVPVDPKCIDNPFVSNCEQVVRAQYCNNASYNRFCCRSCTLAGQLLLHGPHLQRA